MTEYENETSVSHSLKETLYCLYKVLFTVQPITTGQRPTPLGMSTTVRPAIHFCGRTYAASAPTFRVHFYFHRDSNNLQLIQILVFN